MFTTHIPAARGTKLTTGMRAFGAAAALGATLFAAVPAQAAAPARPYGTVTTRAGVNERAYPSTDSSARGVLRYRERVGLVCKVRAQNIEGNTIWYMVRHSGGRWVTAKYVVNTGYVRYCKDVRPDRAPQTTKLSQQQKQAQEQARKQARQHLQPKG